MKTGIHLFQRLTGFPLARERRKAKVLINKILSAQPYIERRAMLALLPLTRPCRPKSKTSHLIQLPSRVGIRAHTINIRRKKKNKPPAVRPPPAEHLAPAPSLFSASAPRERTALGVRPQRPKTGLNRRCGCLASLNCYDVNHAHHDPNRRRAIDGAQGTSTPPDGYP